ncbi:FtsW/RodA/SpoVE family cell cycle protein [Caminibacter pacificus]|uniref:Rod shape-determining protein RodA n=1 Tax=Caminibacter pacificus TaxID=1424653 RepID=A0AAJ4UXD9_9BACT|nr:FtsW/RodA/SpoVE family cell cycle protein [Caminibacter pacificus]QCI28792.1 rod shape-determining protein RodA [Caminibacter pacificus]ROR39380.1 rod shape determining protein RodA [Caminibacter pacificus]
MRKFDFLLILLLLPFIFVSLYLVNEISHKLFIKELIYISIGIVVFIAVYFIPIRKLLWVIPIVYWINIILLLLVDLVGIKILGAQRWLKIPIINLTIQPSEFMKTTLLLMLGYLIYRYPPRPTYTLKEFLRLSIYIIIPFLLIAKEPDLGTALILLIIGFGVLFIVGVDKKIWITLIIGGVLFAPVAYKYLLKDYQKKRIENFLTHPSYHVKQSMIAIGSGGFSGKSKNEATQTQLKFLPIASSDFIFAYLVERFGFLGAIGIIFLYFVLILHLLNVAEKLKDDYFAKVMFAGVALMIFVYSYINIAMTMNLGPVVGVPLPLLSHGGTSFINFMILFAILENLISRKDFLHTHGVK